MELATIPILASIFVLVASAVYGILTSRLVIRTLISAELLFNAALLSLLLVASQSASAMMASALVLLAIVLTAAEVGVVAAIIVFLFHEKGGVETERMRRLRG